MDIPLKAYRGIPIAKVPLAKLSLSDGLEGLKAKHFRHKLLPVMIDSRNPKDIAASGPILHFGKDQMVIAVVAMY